jgi:hypothetical protein
MRRKPKPPHPAALVELVRELARLPNESEWVDTRRIHRTPFGHPIARIARQQPPELLLGRRSSVRLMPLAGGALEEGTTSAGMPRPGSRRPKRTASAATIASTGRAARSGSTCGVGGGPSGGGRRGPSCERVDPSSSDCVDSVKSGGLVCLKRFIERFSLAWCRTFS